MVDGVVYPMVELDYCNLHITMAYAEAGEPMPGGDQYTIDGFPRGLVKVAVNTLFNAASINSGILAVTDELRDDPELRAVCGIQSSDRGPCRTVARQDSDMAIEVMTRMISQTGRCPLPVHDSFLVPQMDADILSQTMMEVAGEFGLEVKLKSTGDS